MCYKCLLVVMLFIFGCTNRQVVKTSQVVISHQKSDFIAGQLRMGVEVRKILFDKGTDQYFLAGRLHSEDPYYSVEGRICVIQNGLESFLKSTNKVGLFRVSFSRNDTLKFSGDGYNYLLLYVK